MQYKALFALLLALILEVSVTTIPLVLLVLLCLTVIYREENLFFFAFLFGILLDLFALKTIGLTSAYLVFILFLILTYQKKFEIATNYFVFIASVIGSVGFLFFLGYNNLVVLQSIVSGFLGVLIFTLFKKTLKTNIASDTH